MLKRIYIDNFRCFVNFEYKPERKQLLLGANGSGKSSLLDALRMLKVFLEGGALPFTQSSRTRWQDKQDKPLQIFEIDALLEGKLFSYRTEILYASRTNSPFVNMERLSVEGAPVFEYFDRDIREMRSYVDGKTLAIPQHREKIESSLHFWAGQNPSVSQFVEWMTTVHCFKVNPDEDNIEETADFILLRPDDELKYIAPWYRHLNESDPEGMDAFRSSMREVLSGFLSLRLSSEDNGVRKLRADFTSPTQRKLTVSLHELSDGQRCLIALYMILHFLIAKGHTVFLDEPDNFISLREIQPWLMAAEDAVEDSKGQLILISHHPEILNRWSLEYGLQFTREENGQVRPPARFKTDFDGVLPPAEVVARGWENE
jgi:predicted ATPase